MQNFLYKTSLFFIIFSYITYFLVDDITSIIFILSLLFEDFVSIYFLLIYFSKYIYENFIFIFGCFLYLLKFFQQSRFYSSFLLALASLFIFLIVVLVRIATPRFKIESLTKLGWTYGLLILLLCIIFYLIGFHMF